MPGQRQLRHTLCQGPISHEVCSSTYNNRSTYATWVGYMHMHLSAQKGPQRQRCDHPTKKHTFMQIAPLTWLPAAAQQTVGAHNGLAAYTCSLRPRVGLQDRNNLRNLKNPT